MLVKVFGGAVNGIDAITITIEVNILWGAKFIIVGLEFLTKSAQIVKHFLHLVSRIHLLSYYLELCGV